MIVNVVISLAEVNACISGRNSVICLCELSTGIIHNDEDELSRGELELAFECARGRCSESSVMKPG